ncbi:MAG: cobalt-precorrin-5B (C(1))-methyltransferase CbiD [Lachnospiraceae bacterium]
MTKKKLRNGYTTGSCSAAAAKAALWMLLTKEIIQEVSIITPNHTPLYLEVEDIVKKEDWVSCGIRKDAGDDPDMTNGILVYATVSKIETGIIIEGGLGIGRVTRKGLQQKVGEAAINKVPRQMIQKEIEDICEHVSYSGGIHVCISIPEGEKLAVHTFNPRLGIMGGLSILGTTGIVEPMSEKALIDTIYVEMNYLKENGHEYCYIVPGNYGSDFLTDELKFNMDDAVKCSNYIGETIEFAKQLGLKGILFVGHIGKFVKLAAGIMNTHSQMADARMEIMGVHAALAGADQQTVTEIMNGVTTTEVLELLDKKELLNNTMASIMKHIDVHLQRKASQQLQIGAIVFSEAYGVLGQTSQVNQLVRQCQKGRRTE